MLPREFVEKFLSGSSATRLHVIQALSNTFDSLSVVLALPLQILGDRLVKSRARVPARRRAKSSTEPTVPLKQAIPWTHMTRPRSAC